MTFHNSKTLKGISFSEVKSKLIDNLKEEGFGILTEIDLKDTLNKKLGKDYLPHTILGACNPVFADKVLAIEPHISTMLPCNVTIRQLGTGDIEVSTINPAATMNSVGNAQILPIASEVQEKLLKVINKM